MSVTWIDMILAAIVILLIILPPKYDPAICFKQWLKSRRDDDG